MTNLSHSHQYPDDASKAQRLAFLLAQSVMSQEQKEAWINVLPLMTPEQADMLIALLEREHYGYVEVSQSLLEDLKRMETELQKKIDQLKTEERRVIEEFIKQRLAQLQS